MATLLQCDSCKAIESRGATTIYNANVSRCLLDEKSGELTVVNIHLCTNCYRKIINFITVEMGIGKRL